MEGPVDFWAPDGEFVVMSAVPAGLHHCCLEIQLSLTTAADDTWDVSLAPLGVV